MKKIMKRKKDLLEIVKYPNDILRAENREIEDPSKYVNLAQNMIYTMRRVGGVGIAAPQIEKNIRMGVALIDRKPFVFFNPEILNGSPGGKAFQEGCLSVPGKSVLVDRPTWIEVKYTDLKGKEHIKIFEDIDCVIMCHEIDHLDGKLIIDYEEN
jgi:peptide deformylase